MTSHRKSIYIPRFGSQSSQTDKKPKPNEQKLRKNMKKMISLPVQKSKSAEISPCYSRKRETKLTSTVTVRAAEGGKPSRAKQPHTKPSHDHFEFPPADDGNRVTDKMSRAKQDVLRTIRRMVEENRVIRERLLNLSQMRQSK